MDGKAYTSLFITSNKTMVKKENTALQQLYDCSCVHFLVWLWGSSGSGPWRHTLGFKPGSLVSWEAKRWARTHIGWWTEPGEWWGGRVAAHHQLWGSSTHVTGGSQLTQVWGQLVQVPVTLNHSGITCACHMTFSWSYARKYAFVTFYFSKIKKTILKCIIKYRVLQFR